jgi:methionyl-tRNA formyltransferase
VTVRIVVVTRNERGIASRFLRRALPGELEVAAVLHDQGTPTSRAAHYRVKALKLRRLGPTIAPVAFVLRPAYARADAADVPALGELPVRVERVTSANSEVARDLLRELEPDLALTLGSRFLHERTFSIPRLGTINVHHGRVPEYRGGPPIFWELVAGEAEVGYIVHQIDAGIDTGAVYASGSVAIERRSSLADTILATLPPLYERSLDTLTDVLVALAQGAAEASPQPPAAGRPNSSPRLSDYLRARGSLRAAR